MNSKYKLGLILQLLVGIAFMVLFVFIKKENSTEDYILTKVKWCNISFMIFCNKLFNSLHLSSKQRKRIILFGIWGEIVYISLGYTSTELSISFHQKASNSPGQLLLPCPGRLRSPFYLFIYLFFFLSFFGCTGSSLLHAGSLYLW